MSEDQFSPDARETLAAVLDGIIPANDAASLPGAGSLGVASYLETIQNRKPELVEVFALLINALDAFARARDCDRFAALPLPARAEALQEIARTHPGPFSSLLFHTYAGYYQEDRVLEAQGVPARAPFPEGYEMEPNDLSLLDAVRQRPKMFRE